MTNNALRNFCRYFLRITTPKSLVLAVMSMPLQIHAHAGKAPLDDFNVGCEFLLQEGAAQEYCIWLKENVERVANNSAKVKKIAAPPIPGGLPDPVEDGSLRLERDSNHIDLYWLRYATANGSIQRTCLHVPPIFVWKRYPSKIKKFFLSPNPSFEDASDIAVGGIVLDSPSHRTYVSIEPTFEHALNVTFGVDVPCDDFSDLPAPPSKNLIVGNDGKIFCRYPSFTAMF